jgi:hypothetical protein
VPWNLDFRHLVHFCLTQGLQQGPSSHEDKDHGASWSSIDAEA